MSKPDATTAKWDNDNGLVVARFPDGSSSFDIFDASNWNGTEEEAQRIAAKMVAAVNSHDAALKLADAVRPAIKVLRETCHFVTARELEELARQVKEAAK